MKPIEFIDRKTGKIISEKTPSKRMLEFLYLDPIGRNTLLHLVSGRYLSSMYGAQMSRPGSVRSIPYFVDMYQINMEESLKSIDEFSSFNDFFYRKLKKDARPIGEGLVSPGDGKLLAFNHISEVNEFFVKRGRFKLSSFLKNSNIAKKYYGGQLLILRLAPTDYHRFHFPLAGTPTEMTDINGAYYSVSPIALQKYFLRVFNENKRAFCELNTDYGSILLAPVGATMVGSILDTYTPNEPVNKGDEMGYFAFGGSTILMALEPGNLILDHDLVDNTAKGFETAVQMGEQIGVPLIK